MSWEEGAGEGVDGREDVWRGRVVGVEGPGNSAPCVNIGFKQRRFGVKRVLINHFQRTMHIDEMMMDWLPSVKLASISKQ